MGASGVAGAPRLWLAARLGWQRGFAAFSVSRSRFQQVYEYIARQEEHHRKVSFKDELTTVLKRHGIEYDDTYLWL